MALILPLVWALVILGSGASAFRPSSRLARRRRTRPRHLRVSRRTHRAVAVLAIVAVWKAGIIGPASALAVLIVVRRSLRTRAARHARERQVRVVLPDAIELASVAAEAGATPLEVIEALARWGPDPVRDAAAKVQHRWEAGDRFARAVAGLADDLGPPVLPFVRVVTAADRDGVALGPPLRGVADQLRADRRRAAEGAARRLSVTLLFPLTFCVLPALALVVLAPVVAEITASLRL